MPTPSRYAAAAFVALAGLLTGCTASGGVVAHGPAPTAIPWTGPVYVLDREGRPRRQPDLFDVTADSSFGQITWKHWGGPRAVGAGWEVDLACLAGCKGDSPDSYPATIVLSGLTRRENAAYYSHASFTSPRPLPSWAEKLGEVTLRVPAR